MAGMLYSLWSAVEQTGRIIETKTGIVKAIEFDDEDEAAAFCRTAHNSEMWFDYLSPNIQLVRDVNWVDLRYQK